MRIRSARLLPWVEIWPVTFPKGPPKTWQVRWRTVAECAVYKCFWRVDDRHITMGAAAKRTWGCREHIITGLRRRGIYRPVVVVWNGIVIDGNHTLIALLRRKSKARSVMVVEGKGKP